MQKWLWRMTNSAPDRVLINDPKKLFRKKLYVTIPQWFETFLSMSDLSSVRNSAKCGLQLNDPIDWFKLRLNQPKTILCGVRCAGADFLPTWLEGKGFVPHFPPPPQPTSWTEWQTHVETLPSLVLHTRSVKTVQCVYFSEQTKRGLRTTFFTVCMTIRNCQYVSVNCHGQVWV